MPVCMQNCHTINNFTFSISDFLFIPIGAAIDITKEFIIFSLNKFRNLDLRFEKDKERLIDGLVKAIFVYDDYIKLILTFDDKPINIPTSDEIENMANSSDIQSNVSPKKTRAHRALVFFCDPSRSTHSKRKAF